MLCATPKNRAYRVTLCVMSMFLVMCSYTNTGVGWRKVSNRSGTMIHGRMYTSYCSRTTPVSVTHVYRDNKLVYNTGGGVSPHFCTRPPPPLEVGNVVMTMRL